MFIAVRPFDKLRANGGGGVTSLAPVVAMIAVFALTGGGIHLLRGGRDRKKGGLMLACAAVILGNVVIWTV